MAPVSATINRKFEEILKAITISWCERRIEISLKEKERAEKSNFVDGSRPIPSFCFMFLNRKLCNIFWIKRKFCFCAIYLNRFPHFPFLHLNHQLVYFGMQRTLSGDWWMFAWEKYFVFQERRERRKKKDLLTMELFIFLRKQWIEAQYTKWSSASRWVIWIDNDSFL